MIDLLNDDCQLQIINYLNTKDQLSVWKTKLSERLNTNIFRAWRLHVDFYYIFEEFKNNIALLNAFLSSVCETLRSLTLENIELYRFQIFQNFRFPNLRKLYIDGDQHQFELLPKLFPELTSLTVRRSSDVSSLRLASFRKLRRVVLWCCYNFAEMFASESLEEIVIEIDGDRNSIYRNDFMFNPKLHTLALTCYEYEVFTLEPIIKQRSNDITEMSLYASMYNYNIPLLQSLKSLVRLTLIEEIYPVEDFQSIVSRLPLLGQLDVVNCELFSTEIQLWQTIAVCPSLKILNISRLKLTNDFFEPTRHYMEQALRNRTEPLTLHWHDTGDEHLIEEKFIHPNLSISFLKLPLRRYYTCFTGLQLRPLITA